MWNIILNYLLECIFTQKERYPTILFFRTGSYTMMGGTEENILKECEMFVISLIERFHK